MCTLTVSTCACRALKHRQFQLCSDPDNPDLHATEKRYVEDLSDDCPACWACPLARCGDNLRADRAAVQVVGGCRHLLFEYGSAVLSRNVNGDPALHLSVIDIKNQLCDACRTRQREGDTPEDRRRRVVRLLREAEAEADSAVVSTKSCRTPVRRV